MSIAQPVHSSQGSVNKHFSYKSDVLSILCIVLIREHGTWHSLISLLPIKHLHFNNATSGTGRRRKQRDIPPAFHEDMTLREMKISFKSSKGALTSLSNQVKVRAETFVAIKSPEFAIQLNESYNKFLVKCDFQHRVAHQLALEDEENSAAWTNAQEQLQPIQETIERIYGDAHVQLGIGAPMPETGTVAPGAAKVRVRHNLKPWELSASAAPSEFRRWRKKYEQYYLGSDIGVTNLLGQQATISGCVDRGAGTAPIQHDQQKHASVHTGIK